VVTRNVHFYHQLTKYGVQQFALGSYYQICVAGLLTTLLHIMYSSSVQLSAGNYNTCDMYIRGVQSSGVARVPCALEQKIILRPLQRKLQSEKEKSEHYKNQSIEKAEHLLFVTAVFSTPEPPQ